jgi:hypothetical protein
MKQRRIPAVRVALKKALTFHRLVAIALMFWCAGTGCMIVSYARASAKEDSSAQSAEQPMIDMHASMSAHACCKAKHKGEKRTASAKRSSNLELTEFTIPVPAQSDAMSCCPLTSGSIVVATRSQTDDSTSTLAQTGSSSLKLSKSDHAPVAIPLRLPSRADSYLLGCAFLI